MTHDSSLAQWECFLKNLGDWQGSFTRLSPEGNIENDTPTRVNFEGLDGNQIVKQTIQYYSDQSRTTVAQEKVFELTSLNRSVLFFDDGAFSQGSIQLAPFSEFGAELGFIHGDRRLRLVQIFNKEGHFDRITLIREKRAGTNAGERPPLRIESLLGKWQGQAVTLYLDGRLPETSSTSLHLERHGEQLSQHLTANTLDFTSTGQIDGSILRFGQGTQPVQVLLLPDGASCTSPLNVEVGRPLFLEAGWLIAESLRQRMIRGYNVKGEWVSLTLVTERKLTP